MSNVKANIRSGIHYRNMDPNFPTVGSNGNYDLASGVVNGGNTSIIFEPQTDGSWLSYKPGRAINGFNKLAYADPASGITTVLPIENIQGSVDGYPNAIIYFGPDLDMDDPASPITAANTLIVYRWNQTTNAVESYVPGGGANDFTTLTNGFLGHGRLHLIVALEDFILDYCVPGLQANGGNRCGKVYLFDPTANYQVPSSLPIALFDQTPGGALDPVALADDAPIIYDAEGDKIFNFALFSGTRITSIQSGNWTSTAIWDLGRIPIAGDVVWIKHNVVYNSTSTASIKVVSVMNNASLFWDTNVNTYLRVQHFVIREIATVTIGTVNAPMPINSSAIVEFANVALDTTNDPAQFGNGLVCLGTIRVCGFNRGGGFARVAAETSAGASAVTLTSAVASWQTGDRLLIPDTRQYINSDTPFQQIETRTLTSLSGSNTVAHLSSALTFDHKGPRNEAGTLVTGMLWHAANLTRNVTFRSEDVTGVPGHCIFPGRCDVDIRYASFFELSRTNANDLNNTTFVTFTDATNATPIAIAAVQHGLATGAQVRIMLVLGNTAANGTWTITKINDNQFSLDGSVGNGVYTIGTGAIISHIGTNQIGRYPLHMHHCGGRQAQSNGYQYTLIGNVIDGGANTAHIRKWGITIHGTHFGLVQNNVIYNTFGGGYVFEDGSEYRNVVDANMVCLVAGPGNREDNDSSVTGFARNGGGFWMRSGMNLYTSNVACNCGGYGLILNAIYLPDLELPTWQGSYAETGTVSVPGYTVGTNQFDGFESYSCNLGGMTSWWWNTYSTDIRYVAPRGVLKDWKLWHQRVEFAYFYPISQFTIRGWECHGDQDKLATADSGTYGWTWHNDYRNRNLHFVDCVIDGIKLGVDTSPDTMDVTLFENCTITAGIAVHLFGASSAGTFLSGSALGMRDRTFIFRDCDLTVSTRFVDVSPITGNFTKREFFMVYGGETFNVSNFVLNIKVYYFNRAADGLDYRVYLAQQLPSFVVPQTFNVSENMQYAFGCPESGLTNQQAHDKYMPYDYTVATPSGPNTPVKPDAPNPNTPGLCISGELIPNTATTATWTNGYADEI